MSAGGYSSFSPVKIQENGKIKFYQKDKCEIVYLYQSRSGNRRMRYLTNGVIQRIFLIVPVFREEIQLYEEVTNSIVYN
jgi:hypothetical protein